MCGAGGGVECSLSHWDFLRAYQACLPHLPAEPPQQRRYFWLVSHPSRWCEHTASVCTPKFKFETIGSLAGVYNLGLPPGPSQMLRKRIPSREPLSKLRLP